MSIQASQTPEHHKVVIVGAGPGGLQLAHDLQSANVDYLVLERAAVPGATFATLPVHRKLLSINKIHTGCSDPEKNRRWDWNSLMSDVPQLRFGNYDRDFFPHADSLVRYFGDFCTQLDLRVRFDSDVSRIERAGEGFAVCTAGTWLTCDFLVVATGVSIPYVPPIAGIELAEPYGSHDRSPERSQDRDILIIGKGNSAFETAEALLHNAARIHLVSPAYLRLAMQTHFVGHVRQINSPFLDTFILKQQNAVLNGTIERIVRADDKFTVDITFTENAHKVRWRYDRVIACTGYAFDAAAFAADVRPKLIHGNRLPELSCRWESSNVARLYFCGTLMQSNDYKKSASAFIHGIRYNARALCRILEERLGLSAYPRRTVLPHSTALFSEIYERLAVVSSLWHLHGSMCDAYVFSEREQRFEQLTDMPIRMMAEDPAYAHSSRIEFRFTFDNPQDPAERDWFSPNGLLHPAIYLFVGGSPVAERHMYEDVYTEWQPKEFGFRFSEVLPGWIDTILAADRGPALRARSA